MDYYKLLQKRSMTPEKMVKILGEHGTVVSIERAAKVLELVYKLSNLSMKETLARAINAPAIPKQKRFTRHLRKKKDHEDC